MSSPALQSTTTMSPSYKSEKAALLSRQSDNLLPLHSADLREVELARAEAVWDQAQVYRPMIAIIYIAAFLFLFQFLAGTTFVSAILEEFKAAQVAQTFP